VNPSSETEIRSRGRLALDRGRASRERGRPALERGGVPPSSETEPLSRGRPTHERGGFVPGWRRTPRVERGSAQGWLGRLFDGPWARGFVLRVCLGSFACIFYEFKRVSLDCLGPSWLSPTDVYICD
jgi:hypothetical protein